MQRPFWHGDKVRLRSFREDDWHVLHGEEADSEGVRALEPGVTLPRDPEQIKAWLRWAREQRGQEDFIVLAVESHDGELVGSVNLHERDARNGTCSYAVRIFRPHRRQGYARDAVQLLLRYAFRELRYQKVNATTVAFNEESLRLQRGLGFSEEGRRRRMVYSAGAFHDEVCFGMTREEFEACEGLN